MLNKKIILASAGILLNLSMTACQNKAQSQAPAVQKTSSAVKNSNEQASSANNQAATSQTNSSQEKESNETKFSNNEWMLMGYLAYKNKSVNNLDSTINSISDDLKGGNLEAAKKSDNSYTLSNQYGSVDVKVNARDVVVTGDGVTRTSKKDLEKLFAGQVNSIAAMSKYVGVHSSLNKNNTTSSGWKNGTPSELVGEYTSVQPGSEQGSNNAAVIDIRNGKIITWSSGMPTFYDYNIKYRKEGNKYIFKFDSTLVGGPLKNGAHQEQQTGNSLTLEKVGDTYHSDYTGETLYRQDKFTLDENPPAE